MTELAARITASLGGLADPERAPAMAAYMKVAENGTLPFLGVRRPEVRRVARTLARGADADDLLDTVNALWDGAEHREQRYAAQDLLGLRWARARLDLLDLHRHHIVTGAWWDHVDETAHRICELVDAHPETMRPVLVGWSLEEDRWLRRSAIIAQLGRRERTDLDLLSAVIEPNRDHPDFFVRKAIGWALREVGKRDPAWVLRYTGSHQLSPLSRREALKHLA